MTNIATDQRGTRGTFLGCAPAADLVCGDVMLVFGAFVVITSTYHHGDTVELDGDNVDRVETGRHFTASPSASVARYAVFRS